MNVMTDGRGNLNSLEMDDKKNEKEHSSSRSTTENKTVDTTRTITKKMVTKMDQQKAEPVSQNNNHKSTSILTENQKKPDCTDQNKASGDNSHFGEEEEDSNASDKGGKEKRKLIDPKLIIIAVSVLIGVLLGLIILGIFSMIVKTGPEVSLKGLTRIKGIESNKLKISINPQDSVRASLNSLSSTDQDGNHEYFYCEGNGKVPGSIDVALILNNMDQCNMELEKIEVKLLDFDSLENVQYTSFSSENEEKMNCDALCYCLIDPVLPSADAHFADSSGNKNEIGYAEAERQNQAKTIISSGSRNYGLKLEFTNYGIYCLQIRVRYFCNGKYLYSESNPDLRIIYDSKGE